MSTRTRNTRRAAVAAALGTALILAPATATAGADGLRLETPAVTGDAAVTVRR